MVERRKAELRAERDARLAEALRRNLRRRKDAGEAGQSDAPAGASPAGSERPVPPRDEPHER
jgi:hypothetical protein